jgi:predicted TIM-barrel fold metal-dependent hydrolase
MKRERIAIDAWATFVSPEGAKRWPPEFLHIFRKYRSPPSITEGQSVEALLAEMDAAGVERIVLSAFHFRGAWILRNEEVAELVRRHPDRFIGAGTVDVMRKPMDVAGEVERLVRDLGLRCIRLEPYMYGDGMTGLPPNDKHYWPVYMKCSELGVAVAVQVGHTGPLLPSECGRPIYLDEVALAFPDLVILGCHVGQPWHEEMMVLAWKHPNVYLETSARGPRQWPQSLVDFARSWGQDKLIWATDYPLLGFDRTLGELEDLGMPPEVFRKLVRENLLRALRLEQ